MPYVDLKIRTYHKLRNIRGRKRRQHFHLATLLGYRHIKDYHANFNERDVRICQMLLGPHGETIYKALRARRVNNPPNIQDQDVTAGK